MANLNQQAIVRGCQVNAAFNFFLHKVYSKKKTLKVVKRWKNDVFSAPKATTKAFPSAATDNRQRSVRISSLKRQNTGNGNAPAENKRRSCSSSFPSNRSDTDRVTACLIREIKQKKRQKTITINICYNDSTDWFGCTVGRQRGRRIAWRLKPKRCQPSRVLWGHRRFFLRYRPLWSMRTKKNLAWRIAME